uniref:Uncharacterized protein n=1 Tax=Macaca fascicularis TaxID=9541 RepID=Q9BGZ1_MACFA|nr:hypothetical protein [Macaca fascicularis]
MGRTETPACRQGPLLPLPWPVPSVGHAFSPLWSCPLHLPVGSSGPHSTRNMRCPAAYLLLLGRPRPKNQRSTLAGFWNVPELSGYDFFLSSSPELLEAHSFPSFGGGTPQVPIPGLLGQASSLTAACCPHGVKVQAGRDLAPPTDPGLRSPVGFFTCGAFQVGTSSSGPQGDTCSQEGSLDPG